MSTQAPFDNVPEELYDNIASFLHSSVLILTCRHVNKAWQRATQRVLTYYDEREIHPTQAQPDQKRNDRVMRFLAKNYPNIQSVTFRSETDWTNVEHNIDALQHCKHLRYVAYGNKDFLPRDITSNFFRKFPRYCAFRIDYIEFNEEQLLNILNGATITRVSIETSSCADENTINSVFKLFYKHITKIDIQAKYISHTQESLYQYLLNSTDEPWPNVTHFGIMKGTNASQDQQVALFKKMPNIKHVYTRRNLHMETRFPKATFEYEF
jgi:hypothetical protein